MCKVGCRLPRLCLSIEVVLRNTRVLRTRLPVSLILLTARPTGFNKMFGTSRELSLISRPRGKQRLKRQTNNALLLHEPRDKNFLLFNHYFSLVCPISSLFDSGQNPFRSYVSEMMASSRLLFLCVMNMSASDFRKNDGSSIAPLSFQTEAISEISEEPCKITNPTIVTFDKPNNGPSIILSTSLYPVEDEVLLGIILLGITSSWYDPSSLDLSHIDGSRLLFQSWAKDQGLDCPSESRIMTRIQAFLVPSMVYCEVLSLAYLDTFLENAVFPSSFVCPWTGVETSVFSCLGRIGSPIRRKRSLVRTTLQDESGISQGMAYMNSLNEASLWENQMHRGQLPKLSSIEDTGDIKALLIHFRQLAHCYQLGGCLEPYCAFPELARARLESDPAARLPCDGIDKQSQLLLGIALDILNTLETIPDDCRTIATWTLVLIIAGSVLGKIKAVDERQFMSEQYTFNRNIERWGKFVLQSLSRIYQIIGLRTIQRAITLLVEVRSHIDFGTAPGDQTE
ncbi:fungal-specific transcription factor domain-containing protein [Colletotrichum godetiae]|uniref:Fungal-specific transcription factor domain-containing protein n=1 Tax=Colletotrichum godetiae TaxID=1209918 RepID=A0AAJ0AK83_9PEZI|nr:fungal-specific transcription factor domain-containing protein [Colletotrichum godetiae]KAK1675402.1 fungal-specific transcription factor domain-containing protein [Colletotrichum godetiae]